MDSADKIITNGAEIAKEAGDGVVAAVPEPEAAPKAVAPKPELKVAVPVVEPDGAPKDASEAVPKAVHTAADTADESRARLLKDVEAAARAGARKGRRGSGLRLPWVRIVLVLLVIAALAGVFFGIKAAIESGVEHRGEGIFDVEEDVEGKDITLDNHGFLGYTAADFADVILGDTTHPKRLVIYTVKISDVATVTEVGLAKLTIFSKVQYITFHGTASYTVDLGQVNEYCITVDNGKRTVEILIPHASLESINIPAEEIEFSDIERGLLAFGQLKITPEDQAALEAAVKTKMEQKLLDDKVHLDADRFARLGVWEIYQPLIEKVAPGYALEIGFLG